MRYHSTTGLDPDQLQELTDRITQILDPTPATGRPRRLGLFTSVLITLLILRHNLPQQLVADLFGVSQPTISRTYRRFLPLIAQVLCLHTPPLDQALPGRVVIVDGTLIPTGNRAAHHKDNYSGKHHQDGLSVQVLAALDGTLLAVSDPMPGAMHDRNAFARTGFEDLLTDTQTLGDLGYQGTAAIRPHRKRPKKQRTPADRIYNRSIASLRWAVEQAIAHLKQWKILATGYRGRLRELPQIIRIVSTLEYYRQGW